MQSFYNIPSDETLTNSRPYLLNNDLTVMSQSSGTAFPTENLQIGMPCYRTDLSSLWVLKDTSPTWILIADLNKTYSSQEYVANNFLSLTGGKVLGAVSVTGGLELGKTTVANNVAVDFHSSGNNLDYDARIIASGGTTTSGQGSLNIVSKELFFNGSQVVTKAMLGSGNNVDSDTVDGYHAGQNKAGQLLVLGTNGKVPSSNIPVANATSLGGVIIGSGITVDSNGVISVAAAVTFSFDNTLAITASTQTAITTAVSATSGSGTILNQKAGISAGTYTLSGLLQALVNISHRHETTAVTSVCNCDCNCCNACS